MSFVPRTYPEIVRDLLTVMTGGTVAETVTAPSAPDELLLPQRLAERPVRRISHLEGFIPGPEGQEPLPYRFTAADFELVSSTGEGGEPDSIQVRENGRRPAPGTQLVVNYYPVNVEQPDKPITDLNIGSVARTLMETFGRELAVAYQHLKHIYRSAFLDTAEGTSLDKVVALVGVTRLQPRRPVARLRFTRQPGLSGRITIPANTAVTDADGNRYLLQRTVTLEPTEATREVEARAEFPSTPAVDAGALTSPKTLIAGIESVTNPEPAFQLGAKESDEALRRRARVALQGNVRGTLAAVEDGLRAVDGVRDLSITEAPNGVPGEIRVDVAFSGNPAEVRPIIERRIRELRPAGIRVLPLEEAKKRRVRAQVALILAGSGVREVEIGTLVADAEARLDAYLSALPPGKQAPPTTVRRAKMVAALLADERIADASVSLVEADGTGHEELTLAEGELLEVEAYDFAQPVAEESPEGAAGRSNVFADLPLHPQPGTTMAEAEQAVRLAFEVYVAGRGPGSPLDVDSLRTALRDDSRYALAAAAVVVTVERFDGAFHQFTLAGGRYQPVTGESFEIGGLNIFEPA